MKGGMGGVVAAILFVAILASGRAAAEPGDIFLIRTTAKTPDAVVEAIRAYATEQRWQFLGASKVKKGQVMLVKLCILAVGQKIWPVGLELSALLPCGNLGVYEKNGATELSLLRPHYLELLTRIRRSPRRARSPRRS